MMEITVTTNAILAAYQWTDQLAESLIDLCRRNGRVFGSLPDDGARFEYVKTIFDDAQVFYAVIKREAGYQFRCLKRPCEDCLKSGRLMKFNAIPVDGEKGLRWWRKRLPVNVPDDAACH